jgi:hypothetical protein
MVSIESELNSKFCLGVDNKRSELVERGLRGGKQNKDREVKFETPLIFIKLEKNDALFGVDDTPPPSDVRNAL